MDRVRFGRALGRGTREAAKALLKAADAAACARTHAPGRHPDAAQPGEQRGGRRGGPSPAGDARGKALRRGGVGAGRAGCRACCGWSSREFFWALRDDGRGGGGTGRWDLAAGAARQHGWFAVGMLVVFGWFTVSSFVRARSADGAARPGGVAGRLVGYELERNAPVRAEARTSSGVAIEVLTSRRNKLTRSADRESFPIRVASSRRCIAGGFGRCGSTPGWATRRSRMHATSSCWRMGRRG